MSSPFGIIITGRLFAPVPPDPTSDGSRWMIQIPNAEFAQSCTVVTSVPLPEGMGAAIYYRKGPQHPAGFTFVGKVTNDLPSTHIRLLPPTEELMSEFTAEIGIDIEPLDVLESRQVAREELISPAQRQVLSIVGAQLYKDLTTFLSSHAYTDAGGNEVVPLRAIDKWSAAYENRIARNRRFWDKCIPPAE